MKFELFRDVTREWRFRLVARNGEIVAVSESYKRKESATKTIRQIVAALRSNDSLPIVITEK